MTFAKYSLIKKISFWIGLISLLLVFFNSAYWLFLFIPSLGLWILYSLCLRHLKKATGSGKRIQFVEGGPRVGKTDSQTTIAVTIALKQWKKIKTFVKRKWRKYKHICEIIKRDQFCTDKNQGFIYTYHEMQKAYSFYLDNPQYIPCLVSNITVLYGDKKSMPLNYDQITGEMVAPYGTVFLITEASSMFPIDSYVERTKSEQVRKVSNMFERIGHYLDGYIIMDTQDADNVSKDIKRLSPSILKIDRSLSKIFKIFGMRAFKAKQNERVAEGEIVMREDKDDGYRLMILPCAIGAYDERHLRTLYPSKDEIIQAVNTENLIVEDTAENRKLYNREIIKK